MQTILRTGVWSIYLIAIAVGTICTAYALFIFVAFLLAFGAGFMPFTGSVLAFDAVLLYLVAKYVLSKEWRQNIYRPQIWLPILLGLAGFAWLNYAFVMSFRGF
jgi:hypothetical protein